MDVVWLVLDSLSYRSSSFAPDGPDTTPNLAAIAKESGIEFTEAYAPGPLSPSSHAAMFTGRFPSETGMHEAHPYFDGAVPTIAEHLQGTHETHLLSLNMWLFQGLERGFDHTKEYSRPYLRYREATDPMDYFQKQGRDGSTLRQLSRFALADGKPLRSLANYVSYKRAEETDRPKQLDGDANYQYVETLNDDLESALEQGDGDTFVFVNYMDIHPPFDATDEALERFVGDVDREELPIGADPERHIVNEEKSYDPELMEQLYRASVWDFDRKFEPVLRRFLDRDALVIVTSDHGIWDRDTAYSENRLHVPLVIFTPDETARTVDATVNLRAIPRTISEYVTGNDGGFPSESLLNVAGDRCSVTEVIHQPNEVYRKTGRVDVTQAKETDAEIQQDLVLIEGDTRVGFVAGEWTETSDDPERAAGLRARGEEILGRELTVGSTDVEYDAVTQERLEDLGYL